MIDPSDDVLVLGSGGDQCRARLEHPLVTTPSGWRTWFDPEIFGGVFCRVESHLKGYGVIIDPRETDPFKKDDGLVLKLPLHFLDIDLRAAFRAFTGPNFGG